MMEKVSPIYAARQLQQRDLFSFTPALVADLFSLTRRQAYRLLERMAAEELVAAVERGHFLLLGLAPERVLANPLFIAAHLVTPGYVSYWSALHLYGFTEQAPQTTFVATTRKKAPLLFRQQRYQFVTLLPHKFFGYRRETVGDLPVVVADEAKALLDSLEQPRYAGGVPEVANALRNALDVLDVPTLVEYANRLGDQSLGSRLGYLLAALGQKAPGLHHATDPVKLDPDGPRSGPHDARWQVIVNAPATALFPEGVG